MTEGMIFLWICWIIWTYATFIMEKSNPIRLFIASSSLVAIILSNKWIHLGQLEINLALIYLMFIGVSLMKESSMKKIIYCFITVLLYSSIKIYYVVDPIMFFYSEKIFLVLGSALLILLFFNNWKSQIGSLFIMIGLGEFVFAYLITYYLEEQYRLGLDILDIYAAVFLAISIVYLYGLFIKDAKNLITQRGNQLKNRGL